MAMHNPPHPGGLIKRQCLEPCGLSITEGAKVLGVSRKALSDLTNEKASVSLEMAFRLAKTFGSTPETWLKLQMSYDLWQSRGLEKKLRLKKYSPPLSQKEAQTIHGS